MVPILDELKLKSVLSEPKLRLFLSICRSVGRDLVEAMVLMESLKFITEQVGKPPDHPKRKLLTILEILIVCVDLVQDYNTLWRSLIQSEILATFLCMHRQGRHVPYAEFSKIIDCIVIILKK